MAKEVRYDYKGKEVGTLKKMLSDVVVIEEQWINAANKFFANGYAPMLKFPKALILAFLLLFVMRKKTRNPDQQRWLTLLPVLPSVHLTLPSVQSPIQWSKPVKFSRKSPLRSQNLKFLRLLSRLL